jgi:methyl-accepting chemotaxis protein
MPKFEIKKRFFRSLSFSLAVAFLSLSLTIILITAGSEIYLNYQTQQKAVVIQQQLVAQETANTVKNFTQEKINSLAAVVRFGDLLNADKEDQKLSLDKLLGLEPAFRQVILFDAQKQLLVKSSRLSESMSDKLEEQAEYDLFSQVSQEKTHIGSVYIDEVTSEPMVIMAVPVTDIFGDFQGTLMAEVSLKFMWDLVGGIKIGDKGLAYVVDREGKLIAFGDISRVLKGENLTNLREVNEFINNEEQIAVAETSRGIQNTNVISTFVPLGTPDWAVVIELPTSEANKSVTQMIGLSLLVILLNFILAIITGLYLSKMITRPLVKLKDAAKEISSGKLDAKIQIESKDEIGDLAGNFNDMATKLKESYETLENKVRERTAELNEKKMELEEKIEEMERFHRLTIGREEKILELKEKIAQLEEELKTDDKKFL